MDMDQMDPNIPGLIEGSVTLTITDPQPFVGGKGNRVLDPSRPFTVTLQWEVFGQLVPLWLTALAGNWDVSVYAESIGGGNEIRLSTGTVATTAVQPCTVNNAQPNCTRFVRDVVVPAGVLQEHTPGSDVSGIYKLAGAVFLNSNLQTTPGSPGFDLIGFSEGPVVQMERPA
jgi:hypothetical protein